MKKEEKRGTTQINTNPAALELDIFIWEPNFPPHPPINPVFINSYIYIYPTKKIINPHFSVYIMFFFWRFKKKNNNMFALLKFISRDFPSLSLSLTGGSGLSPPPSPLYLPPSLGVKREWDIKSIWKRERIERECNIYFCVFFSLLSPPYLRRSPLLISLK